MRWQGRRHKKRIGTYVRRYHLWLFRVETTVILIPEWAHKLQMPDFDKEPQVAWLSRAMAKVVAEMDEEDGGKPTIIRCQYKRCKICGKLRIQIGAERQRKTAVKRYDGEYKPERPCGPSCVEDARLLKEAKRRKRL